MTLHEQVCYRGTPTVLEVTVTVCHTAEHYGEEYDTETVPSAKSAIYE